MDCIENHQDCQDMLSTNSLESLKQVRFLQSTYDKIFLTENIVPDRYICLSYCWGTKANTPVLLKANMATRKKDGISISTLPQAFKDIVEICRIFGVEFFWIDGLCIVQDDADDWRTQSALMADIYEHGYFTVAASKSRNPSNGCFTHGLHELIKGAKLPAYTNLYARHTFDSPVDKPDFTKLAAAPLLERAWVYQEMCLSPRVVHYGYHEVYWHCRHHSKRQSTTASFEGFLSHVHPLNISRLLNSMKCDFATTSEHRLRLAWYQMVRAYTTRKLTYASDGLPAIGAIAQRQLDSRVTDQYLAGLWKNTLLFDLGWNYHMRKKIDKTPVTHVPTWSWARFRGPIKWDNLRENVLFGNVKVLETTYNTRGPVVSGMIEKAAITLKAPLLRLCDMLTYEDTRTDEEIENDIFADLLQITPSPPLDHDFVYHSCDWDINYSNDDIDYTTKTYALPLAYERKSVPPQHLHMLMVQESIVGGEFIRVGTVSVINVGMSAAEEHFRTTVKRPYDLQNEDYRQKRAALHGGMLKHWKVLVERIEAMESRVVILV